METMEKEKTRVEMIVDILGQLNGMEQYKTLQEVGDRLKAAWQKRLEAAHVELKSAAEQYDNFQYGDSPRAEEKIKEI